MRAEACLLTAVQQGLREFARDRGIDDLWCDEQVNAEEVGASGMKRSRLGFASAKLPLSPSQPLLHLLADRDDAKLLLGKVAEKLPRMEKVWADRSYNGQIGDVPSRQNTQTSQRRAGIELAGPR